MGFQHVKSRALFPMKGMKHVGTHGLVQITTGRLGSMVLLYSGQDPTTITFPGELEAPHLVQEWFYGCQHAS